MDPTTGPWDDCFIADSDITLIREGQRLRLRSDHDHWVVYDGTPHATCVEPQSGPPDGFTLAPHRLEPGQRLALTFDGVGSGRGVSTALACVSPNLRCRHRRTTGCGS